MKKIKVLTALLLLAGTAWAQKGFNIGASGTFNSTWILNQNNFGTLAPFKWDYVKQSEMDYELTWGGNGGIVLGYNFTRNWGLKLEGQFNVTGQKYKDNFEGPAYLPSDTLQPNGGRVTVTRNIRLSYVQIPLMVKFTSNKSHIAKFFVCLGPQIGIRTAASEKIEVGGIPYEAQAFTPQQKFKTVDAGLALQFGTEIYATDHLYFDVGISVYGGLNDLNGKALKSLGWYSQNDVEYQKSYNFRAGLMVGVHYIIGEGRIDY